VADGLLLVATATMLRLLVMVQLSGMVEIPVFLSLVARFLAVHLQTLRLLNVAQLLLIQLLLLLPPLTASEHLRVGRRREQLLLIQLSVLLLSLEVIRFLSILVLKARLLQLLAVKFHRVKHLDPEIPATQSRRGSHSNWVRGRRKLEYQKTTSSWHQE